MRTPFEITELVAVCISKIILPKYLILREYEFAGSDMKEYYHDGYYLKDKIFETYLFAKLISETDFDNSDEVESLERIILEYVGKLLEVMNTIPKIGCKRAKIELILFLKND